MSIKDILGGGPEIVVRHIDFKYRDKAVNELRSMRVAGLPSNIKKAFDNAENAFMSAQTDAETAEALRLGKDAAHQYDAWRAAGSPQEKKFPWVYVGVGVGGAGLVGGLLWWLWPKKR